MSTYGDLRSSLRQEYDELAYRMLKRLGYRPVLEYEAKVHQNLAKILPS